MKEQLSKDINFSEGHILIVDKPLTWSSTDVVRRIKFMLRRLGHKTLKVGHAGTLDPLATGILIVCLGKATKMVESLQAEEKEYIAEVTLGATTPSFDMEHPVDATYPYEHITRDALEVALTNLCGERLQIPPIYSAKKIDGQRAYEYAREGEEVKMRAALINIYNIELLDFSLPKITINVKCSKGTYIRALAKEIGDALSSGGYLSALQRTRSGGFTINTAYSMDEIIEALGQPEDKNVEQKPKINI